ncbi:phosphatase PAP2 family protein [Plantactinospora endophytica]|uniref:phosphatase PAP2 family protein n=1 Tax=Plantactinospora endophytica TaxID=673535 RepID=UPI001EF3A918|nr:phosphatase PAP2 family protein [Plantactinospora endophytica]
MRGRSGILTASWLVLLTAVQVLAFVVVWRFAVGTEHGQLLDTIALTGNSIGQQRIEGIVGGVLNAVSLLSLLVATAVIGFIALIRVRITLAVVTVLLIAGSNFTTQILKHFIERPDFDVDEAREAAGNSLPSGHTTVAASVAIALVMVLPPRVRGWGALVGAGYAAAAGVATLSAGWHRPSDAVTALLVVGAWASAASLVLLLTQRETAQVEAADGNRRVTSVLAIVGLALLLVAAIALGWTDGVRSTPIPEFDRHQLLVAYGGSAAGIAGTAALMTALVLVALHRVVPRHTGRGAVPAEDEPDGP